MIINFIRLQTEISSCLKWLSWHKRAIVTALRFNSLGLSQILAFALLSPRSLAFVEPQVYLGQGRQLSSALSVLSLAVSYEGAGLGYLATSAKASRFRNLVSFLNQAGWWVYYVAEGKKGNAMIIDRVCDGHSGFLDTDADFMTSPVNLWSFYESCSPRTEPGHVSPWKPSGECEESGSTAGSPQPSDSSFITGVHGTAAETCSGTRTGPKRGSVLYIGALQMDYLINNSL